eukprot:scaffold869_cov303-Pinguiococcus_pyrenoidosus.AAC.20
MRRTDGRADRRTDGLVVLLQVEFPMVATTFSICPALRSRSVARRCTAYDTRSTAAETRKQEKPRERP